MVYCRTWFASCLLVLGTLISCGSSDENDGTGVGGSAGAADSGKAGTGGTPGSNAGTNGQAGTAGAPGASGETNSRAGTGSAAGGNDAAGGSGGSGSAAGGEGGTGVAGETFACGPLDCQRGEQVCHRELPALPGGAEQRMCESFPDDCAAQDCSCFCSQGDAAPCQTEDFCTCTATNGRVELVCAGV